MVEKNPIAQHYKIEKYIEEKGINYVHLQFGFFMQNIFGVHSVEIREDDKNFIPDGKSKASFVDAVSVVVLSGYIITQFK